MAKRARCSASGLVENEDVECCPAVQAYPRAQERVCRDPIEHKEEADDLLGDLGAEPCEVQV